MVEGRLVRLGARVRAPVKYCTGACYQTDSHAGTGLTALLALLHFLLPLLPLHPDAPTEASRSFLSSSAQRQAQTVYILLKGFQRCYIWAGNMCALSSQNQSASWI